MSLVEFAVVRSFLWARVCTKCISGITFSRLRPLSLAARVTVMQGITLHSSVSMAINLSSSNLFRRQQSADPLLFPGLCRTPKSDHDRRRSTIPRTRGINNAQDRTWLVTLTLFRLYAPDRLAAHFAFSLSKKFIILGPNCWSLDRLWHGPVIMITHVPSECIAYPSCSHLVPKPDNSAQNSPLSRK